jgi:hypothetical protein
MTGVAMVFHVLGKKDDLRKMQQVSDYIQKACNEAMVPADIRLTHNFNEVPGQSFNPALTPIIFINQQVEFTGMPNPVLLKNKIVSIRNSG